MDLETVLKWQKEVTGIQKYHDLGYTGKGVTVLCHENTEHAGKAMQVLKKIAPGVNVIFAHVSQRISGNKLLNYTWKIDGKEYEFEEVMNIFKPDIISNSIKSNTTCLERDAKIQPYLDSGQLIMVTCSGNDGSDGAKPMYTNGLVIGACQFYNSKNDIRYVSYSGRTPGENKISYVGFMWDWSGTSAATPFVAGQIALFLERFGKVSQSEFQKLIKPFCKDLGDTGKDWIYGDGLIVLPDKIEREVEIMFTDVDATRWSKKYIDEAVRLGLMTGYEDGTFKPEESLTREQMCVILCRLVEKILNN